MGKTFSYQRPTRQIQQIGHVDAATLQLAKKFADPFASRDEVPTFVACGANKNYFRERYRQLMVLPTIYTIG